MKELEKKSLTDQIYDLLKQDITHNKIKQGQRIDINSLKERFHVSQTPIREALLKLERDGVVVLNANISVEVVMLDKKKIKEICDLICLLDCKAVELAMQLNLSKLVEELEYCVRKHEDSLLLDEDYWHYANKVHQVFYKYADNSLLSRMEAQIHTLSDMVFGEYSSNRENRINGIKAHKKILENVKSSDIKRAKEAMEQHWVNAIKGVI